MIRGGKNPAPETRNQRGVNVPTLTTSVSREIMERITKKKPKSPSDQVEVEAR
jgi:hypothetical protein